MLSCLSSNYLLSDDSDEGSDIGGHPLMMSTKNDQFFDPLPPPSAKMNNRICKHMTNFQTPPPPFHVDVINVWSLVNDHSSIEFILVQKMDRMVIIYNYRVKMKKFIQMKVLLSEKNNKIL